MRFYLVFIILFFIPIRGGAQLTGTLPIDREFKSIRLDPYVSTFEDSAHIFTHELLRSENPPFTPNQGPSVNFKYSNSYFWIQWGLLNKDSIPIQLILEIDNPHINKLQLFSFQDSIWSSSILTGDHFPFSQREQPHAHFIFKLPIPAKTKSVYQLWADKHGEQIQIPLKLWSDKSFNNHSSDLNLFWGIMVGIGFIFVILSLLIFLFYPQKLSFYYWMYTIFMTGFLIAHTGLGYKYIWPEFNWWQSAARPSLAFFMYSFYLLFARSFFNIKDNSPFFNYLTKFLIFLFFVLLIVLWYQNPIFGFVNEYWYNPSYYDGSDLLIYSKILGITFTIVLFTLFSIGLFFYIKEKKIEALWFTISFLMLFTGGFSMLLVFGGFLPDNIVTQNIPLITNSFETIVLAFLLANRFQNIQNQNILLEQKVSEHKLINAQRFIEGQLIERKRLSQELHDGININLANIKLNLSMFAKSLGTKHQILSNIIDKIGSTSSDIRQFSHALSPVILDKFGLIEALQDLIHQTVEAHPEITFSFSSSIADDKKLTTIQKNTIYLSAQELLLNAVKYSNANEIKMTLSTENDMILFVISDNGKGYDSSLDFSGIGLKNISSRVEIVNGKFEISKAEKGMLHKIQIPGIAN